MVVTADIAEVRNFRWDSPGLTWGFVPTMGYLHEGHLSLVRLARAENDRVVVSIFVNPTQFGPGEDLATYPRDLERDLSLLKDEKVDLIFTPTSEQMYPPGYQTLVSVTDVSKPLEGAARPTHFQGVTTVVAKLFNIIQPTRAYFGQKDAQQTVVIRQMVRDLNFGLDIIIGPIIREPDGLAMSSRNVRLSEDQRRSATVLFQTLKTAEAAILAGEDRGDIIRQLMADSINSEPSARLDYVSVADPTSLEELETIGQEALLSLAVFFDPVRLIDNLLFQRPGLSANLG